jgi:hypothetical protein
VVALIGVGVVIGMTATRASAPTAGTPSVAATSSDPPGVTRRSVQGTTIAPAVPTLAAAPPAPNIVAPPTTVAVGPAKTITEREWQLIAKNPAAHIGKRVIVYGHVTQFDSATGTEAFRANVDGVPHKPRYGFVDYETNTFLVGDATTLANLVQGDLFKAEVTVAGAYSYQSTLGATLTAPNLLVTNIDVTGNV